jgi:hypothetical protein
VVEYLWVFHHVGFFISLAEALNAAASTRFQAIERGNP